MVILRSFITKQARPFGDQLLQEKRWQFCDLLLLNKQGLLAINYCRKSDGDFAIFYH
jgi:hypothetical protein